MTDDYRDIYETPVEQLGTGGYCDLAAVVLREVHPSAATYRITDSSRSYFRHIFLVIADEALDIHGFTTTSALLDQYGDDETYLAEPTTPEAVSVYVLNQGRDINETNIVLTLLRDHVRNNPKVFNRNA